MRTSYLIPAGRMPRAHRHRSRGATADADLRQNLSIWGAISTARTGMIL